MRLIPSTFGPLAPYLIDLAAAFEARGLPLMLVGGFGLVLRRQWRQEQGERTLIEAVPPARATEDFDVLLTLELLADSARRLAMREALDEAGYQVEEGMKYLHFIKPDSGGAGRRNVKVDFLAPPVTEGNETLKEHFFRVGPKKSSEANKLHGYRTPEAALLQGDTLPLPLEGQGTDGQERQTQVVLPHPFMLTLMKLCAFRDEYEGRKSSGQIRRDLAAKHVGDVYTLVALLTQAEADSLPELRVQNATHAVVQDAQRIVQTLLANDQMPGTLLLRENLRIESDELTTFLDMLNEAFG